MKNGHILHSFCKFISPQTNVNNGHEKQNKQSTNEQKKKNKNQHKQKSQPRYKRSRDLVTTLKFLNYF